MRGFPEDKISADAGCGSPEELYRQLAQDGFPVCRTYGATHVGQGHCEDQIKKRKRKARCSGGEKRELPPAAAAAELFRGALIGLEQDVAELSRRREYIQDERFVVERHLSGDAGESYRTYHRDGTPEAVWRGFLRGTRRTLAWTRAPYGRIAPCPAGSPGHRRNRLRDSSPFCPVWLAPRALVVGVAR